MHQVLALVEAVQLSIDSLRPLGKWTIDGRNGETCYTPLGEFTGKKMMMQTKSTQEFYVFDSKSSANEDEHENKLTVV